MDIVSISNVFSALSEFVSISHKSSHLRYGGDGHSYGILALVVVDHSFVDTGDKTMDRTKREKTMTWPSQRRMSDCEGHICAHSRHLPVRQYRTGDWRNRRNEIDEKQLIFNCVT
jgi:hypothetical protein